jgi:hypothetical protein
MKNKLNTVLFPFTGFAEMVWDIGTKVAAARKSASENYWLKSPIPFGSRITSVLRNLV